MPPPATPPPKRYKVGEIMRHTGLSRQTIHNYTMLGLITPVERTESGHRLYDESVFDRIRLIEVMKAHRTLQDVKEELDKRDRDKARE
jgi:DNA-binding transcriptional MerR regulator